MTRATIDLVTRRPRSMADVSMVDKLWFLIPEICVFLGAVVVSVMGLSRSKSVRDLTALVTCLFLAAAFVVTPFVYGGDRMDRAIESGLGLMPMLGRYVKMLVPLMGIGLAMLSVGLIDRRLEASFDTGRAAFDPIRVNRGEYFAFFLFSLAGVMLCASANDLIWLFLALELTSLPTYIMVAMSRPSRKAQEAAVKYFFLGAMAAALFLYGFGLLYGATGTIILTDMAAILGAQAASDAGLSSLATVGMVMALLGIAFKIVAAPMHFYAADVYEGAAAPVTAFLAFVPKTAGMIAIILLLGTVGWVGPLGTTGLPPAIAAVLWMMAALTMTLGNIGALLQKSVKRMLAYSSIAHSGYLLIGVIAGPGRGIDAVLFYLLAYGVMNTAAFAVLAGLERRGEEIDSLDDLSGLRYRHPAMAAVMAIAAFSLIGLPPLLGFVGKLGLLVAGVEAGHVLLVVVAVINSAISAWYYLRLVGLPVMGAASPQSESIVRSPAIWPRIAGVAAAIAVVVLPFVSAPLLEASSRATVGYAIAASDEAPDDAVARRDDD
jgi:NADH-quinone oxidoreductase subunit N